ncbi:MAG: NAD-dependent epimerase/dehydratase family protein [Minwuiales bacterium]|nr:NAD-dependent epimerase/dehydratase family protein [Minwuiales bacterium]
MTDAPDQRRALVTGATGFTGSALALELRRRGTPVRALVRPGARIDPLKQAGVDLIEGDLREAKDVLRAAEGVSRIYHIGAVFRTAGHMDSYYYDVNLGGTEHVLEAARRHGVERTIHCSTIGVHGDVQEIPCTEKSPLNPGDVYQLSKLAGEEAAHKAFANGLPGSIFRPATIYGPGDLRLLKLFKMIHTRAFRMFGDGKTLLHPVYIDDLVEGIILCSEHPAALGQTFILGGREYVPLNQMVQLVADAVGVKPPGGHLPVWPLIAAAVVCEGLCRPLGIEPPLHRRRVHFFTKNRAFSIDKAVREIGYQPKVTLADGLKRTAQWYFETGHLSRAR